MTGTSTNTGKTYDEPSMRLLEPGSREPDAHVRGGAADLDVWLEPGQQRGSTALARRLSSTLWPL